MKRSSSIRERAAYGMVIGMSALFLWHFSLIAIKGTVTISEPNVAILVLEMVMLCGCFIFGLWNFIKLLRSV